MTKIYTLAEFRCSECNKLLMKQSITDGRVELKCSRCGRIVSFSSGYQEDHETSKTCELKQGTWFAK